MIPKKQKTSRPRTSSRPAKPVPPPGYEQHQGEISLRMSHFFMRYLNAIYQEFDGDLALVIVLGEVAHHNVSQPLQLGTGLSRRLGKPITTIPTSMRISSPAMHFRSPQPRTSRAKPCVARLINWSSAAGSTKSPTAPSAYGGGSATFSARFQRAVATGTARSERSTQGRSRLRQKAQARAPLINVHIKPDHRL